MPPPFSSDCPSGHTLPALLLRGGSRLPQSSEGVDFLSPVNFLRQLGFCKGLRLLLPLWGLISPVRTVEMLVQVGCQENLPPRPYDLGPLECGEV